MSEKKRRIGPGDTVNVHFDRAQSLFRMIVVYSPAGPGDCWQLEDQSGNPVNVMHFAVMELSNPAPTKEEGDVSPSLWRHTTLHAFTHSVPKQNQKGP